MSEPKEQATRLEPVVPGLWRWSVDEQRIGGRESDAYALDWNGRSVLVDPLPLLESELRRLGEVRAIVLTASCHQRSAWRYRRLLDAPVYAPEGAAGLEEEPDERYGAGDTLPGGIVTFHTPGPTEAMYALWITRPRSAIFLSDLLVHDGSGLPRFIEPQYQDDPLRTRLSVRRVLERLPPLDLLLFGHGPPIVGGGSAALRRALDEDHAFPGLPAY